MSPERSRRGARPYQSPRRAEAAADTRATILATAKRLFIERGFGKVTVNDIAREARIAVPTVYVSAGGKSAILATLIDEAIRDPVVDTTLAKIRECSEPHDVIRVTAHGTRVDNERYHDMIQVMITASVIDEAAASSRVDSDRIYLQALAQTAARLHDLDALQPALTVDRATDILWFFFGHQAWHVYVFERGWSWDDAERWLTGQAAAALLRSPRTAGSRSGDGTSD